MVRGSIVGVKPHRVAEEVLAEHDVNFADARHGQGWTNATWLTDRLVIRVARRPGPADLLRESRLAAVLPQEVGYPPIVDVGMRHGHEWLLTRRMAGHNLEQVWPSLDDSARSRAIEQMWQRAQHVHTLDPDAAAPHVRARSPFFPDSPTEVRATLSRLSAAGQLSSAQADSLGRILDRFWSALPAASRAVNHGDLCAPNTLWREGQVVGLVDFEFAVIAPIAIDLNEITKMAFGPGLAGPCSPVHDVVRAIVDSTMDTAGGPDVLVGYSIMLEAWLLEQQLVAAADVDEAERTASASMLTAFAEGDGGYFAPLLGDLR